MQLFGDFFSHKKHKRHKNIRHDIGLSAVRGGIGEGDRVICLEKTRGEW